MSQFHTEPRYLEQKLFDPIRSRQGVRSILNMTVLPDYMAYLKERLRPAQKIRLDQYRLQTLLMEYTVRSENIDLYEDDQINGDKYRSREPLDTLDSLTEAILKYLRRREYYWLKISPIVDDNEKQRQHHAIETYQAHMRVISKIQGSYLDLKPEDKKEYAVFVPQFYTDLENKEKTLKILEHYLYEKYADIQEIQTRSEEKIGTNGSNPSKNSLSCTLFPLVIEYVLKNIKMREKISNRSEGISVEIEEEVKNKEKGREQMEEQIELSEEDQEKGLRMEQLNLNSPQKSEKLDEERKDNSDQSNRNENGDQFLENESSSSSGISYQFYEQNAGAFENYSDIQIFQQCTLYILSVCKSIPQPIYSSFSMSRSEREYSSARNGNNQSTNTLIKWMEQCKNVPKYKSSAINKEWVFYSNLFHILKKILENIAEKAEEHLGMDIENEQLDATKQNLIQQFDRKIDLFKDFSKKILSEQQISHLTAHYLALYNSKLKFQIQQCHKIQKYELQNESEDQLQKPQPIPLELCFFYFTTPLQITKSKEDFDNMINEPSNLNLAKYKVTGSKIPWEDKYYEYFLKSLADFIQIPTNNRRISQEMTKQIAQESVKDKASKTKSEEEVLIEPNHVKYVKGIYFRNMSRRMDNGESGGGKKGKCLSKEEFIRRDLEYFHIRFFNKSTGRDGFSSKKGKNGKKKKTKKKRGYYDYSSDGDNVAIQKEDSPIEESQKQ